jgi:hypothetical protein
MLQSRINRSRTIVVGFWPNGSVCNPAAQKFNIRSRQRGAFRRHPKSRIIAGNAIDQRAVFRLARIDDRTAIAASKRKRFRIQSESALLSFRAMTTSAMLRQQWSNLTLKIEFFSRSKIGYGKQNQSTAE